MKIHAYKVSSHVTSGKINEILEAIKSATLADRIREVREGQKYRVDQIVLNSSSGIWLMDFVKFREGAGPGKAHRDRATTGFDFDDDEVFSEEVAALYDPATHHFIIQYNHHGARYNIINDYLSSFLDGPPVLFKLLPVMDEETENRYRLKSSFKKVEFTIASKSLSEIDRQCNIGLGQALELGKHHGGEKIKIGIMAGRSSKSFLALQNVRQTVKAVKELMTQDGSPVEKLEVVGRDAEGYPMEVMDFMGRRLGLEYEITPGDDKRLPYAQRCASLNQAKYEWDAILR